MKSVLWAVLGSAIVTGIICAAAHAQTTEDLNVFGVQPATPPAEELSIFAAEPAPAASKELDLFGAETKPAPAKPDLTEARIEKLLGAIEAQSQRIDRLSEMLAAPNPQPVQSQATQKPLATAAKPVLIVESEDWCGPCVGLKTECAAAKDLPFVVEIRPPGKGTRSIPKLWWKDGAGKWQWQDGWSGLPAFLEVYRSSMLGKVSASGPVTSYTVPVRTVYTWEQIANSPGPVYFQGTPRNPIPTTREHLRDEHGIPLEATRGMSQQKLNRLHGYKHLGVDSSRIHRRAYELCAEEYRSKKALACELSGVLPTKSQARNGEPEGQLGWPVSV